MKLKQFSTMKILDHLDLAKAVAGGENPFPISYEIDPSNFCNHDCVWCMYADFIKKKKNMIGEELFRSVVDEIIELGAKSITFTGGGEPLTNPKTVELIPYIREQGVQVALITNGGLLDTEKCEIIVQNCTYVRISVDAGRDHTYENLHKPKNGGNDNYRNVIKTIKELVDLKKKLSTDIQIGLGYLVHPKNTEEVYSFSKQAREIGADYVQIRPVCNLKGQERADMLSRSAKEIEKTLGLVTPGFFVFPMLNRFDEISTVERNYDSCRGNGLIGIIGADSNVYLCCQLKGVKDYILGNLNEHSFKKIWNSFRRKKVIQKINLKKCPPCRYNKYNEILEYLADKERIHSEFL